MAQIIVKATSLGFVGSLRKPGDEFTIDEEAFAKSWMEKIKPDTKPAAPAKDKTPAKAADKPDTKPAAPAKDKTPAKAADKPDTKPAA
ncbi:hypothetical protein [Thalassospira povalilytica]|uniref:hypothetical protein n=1 Tax=Thalassospira povalilytica TaxID=732237 RepID=UPI003AA8BE83